MNYKFADNIQIEEVRAAIANANERLGLRCFIEAERGNLSIFNYLMSLNDTFPEPNTGNAALDREYAILRECRGLTFDRTLNKIVARKWNKFFNFQEKPETHETRIDWSEVSDVFTKEDGSLICPVMVDGHIEYHSKMGLTDTGRMAEKFVKDKENYANVAEWACESDQTLLYEFCSRSNRIVLDYPVDNLILLGMRDNITGEYASYQRLVDLSRDFSIPLVKRFDEFSHELVDTMTGIEGFVVVFGQHRLKIKTAEYRILHKIKSDIAFEKDVFLMVVQDKTDDVLPLLNKDDGDLLLDFSKQFHINLMATAERLEKIVSDARQSIGDDKKRFAIEVATKYPERGILFQIWDGKDAVDVIKKILSGVSSQRKVDECRHLVGNISWTDYQKPSMIIED